MAEIFKEAQAFDNHPGRWNHDLSHKHYGTFKAGRLYPVFSHLMCPSDSINMDISALLQFMPTPTPLQSKMRVIFHTFFQRLKNVHKDWPNTIEMLEDHELPYVLPSQNEFYAGSLHDYLDVPCSIVGNGVTALDSLYGMSAYSMGSDGGNTQFTFTQAGSFNGANLSPRVYDTIFHNGYYVGLFDFGSRIPVSDVSRFFSDRTVFRFSDLPFIFSRGSSTGEVFENYSFSIRLTLTNSWGVSRNFSSPFVLVPYSGYITPAMSGLDYYEIEFSSSALVSALETLHYDGSQFIHYDLLMRPLQTIQGESVYVENVSDERIFGSGRDTYSLYVYKGLSWHLFNILGSFDLRDFPTMIPYATKEDTNRPIRLKAYRYRCYESNYNAFYRNIHGNQPFKINGIVQYNKYNTTTDSGLDETHYDFFNRNWEMDAYTSCLPSPQQGNVPLVGVSATGRVVVQDDDGTRSTMQLRDLDDGVQGFEVTQFNAASDEHRQIMMRLADSGFTINDLRETNALQKFLETNIRKGFRYIDFVKGHFGKAPKHAEMDMPEFIGGFTVGLDVGKVTNTNAGATANNPEDVLGQFAGSAQAFGSSKHSINYYADDYGYLQVIMCIVPDSAYSQILPKDFLYSSPLDFPFPEFSNLGYQPITYEEFCPVEAYKDYLQDNNKKLTDVFGYQRPQHERVWLPDRLHGQFLTTMNNYAVNRVFEHRPELGDEFLQIQPGEITRNFTVTKADEDIAFGQIGFRISYKQPVPRISIPSLGR